MTFLLEVSSVTCLDSCSDSGGGCDAQALLAKAHHGLVASLLGLHNVLIYFLEGHSQQHFDSHQFN